MAEKMNVDYYLMEYDGILMRVPPDKVEAFGKPITPEGRERGLKAMQSIVKEIKSAQKKK